MDSLTVSRVRKLLWPASMAQTTFVFGKSLFWQHFGELKAALGFASGNPPNSGPPTDTQRVDFRNGKERGALSPATKRQTPDGATAERASPSPATTGDASGGGATRFPKDPPKDETKEGVFVPDSIQRWIKYPWRQSYKTFAETWTPTMGHPPRGCILLSGLVELETPKVVFVVDVASWWNPTTKKFDLDSMVLNLRRFEARHQRPLR